MNLVSLRQTAWMSRNSFPDPCIWWNHRWRGMTKRTMFGPLTGNMSCRWFCRRLVNKTRPTAHFGSGVALRTQQACREVQYSASTCQVVCISVINNVFHFCIRTNIKTMDVLPVEFYQSIGYSGYMNMINTTDNNISHKMNQTWLTKMLHQEQDACKMPSRCIQYNNVAAASAVPRARARASSSERWTAMFSHNCFREMIIVSVQLMLAQFQMQL